jgi:hypothetical protein
LPKAICCSEIVCVNSRYSKFSLEDLMGASLDDGIDRKASSVGANTVHEPPSNAVSNPVFCNPSHSILNSGVAHAMSSLYYNRRSGGRMEDDKTIR